jgi:hypothetical protein
VGNFTFPWLFLFYYHFLLCVVSFEMGENNRKEKKGSTIGEKNHSSDTIIAFRDACIHIIRDGCQHQDL